MPVNLDIIPAIATKVVRPRVRRWLIFWAFLLLAGAVATLWFWKNEHTGMAFWFTAAVVPTAVWGVLFSLRRISYKCDQIWAASWNKERNQLLEDETVRGQRHLWLHGCASFTTLGKNTGALVSAVLKNTPLMSSSVPRTGGATLRHTRLGNDHSTVPELLLECRSVLSVRMNSLLDALPAEMPCYVLLDIHVDSNPAVNAAAAQEFREVFSRPLRQLNGSGLAALDSWTDMTWGIPSALLIVSTQINASPTNNSGEAAAAMLLTNCPSTADPQAVHIHRPERGSAGMLSKTMSRALLWAKAAPASVTQAWLTGGNLLTDSGWSTACETNALALNIQKQCGFIDNITGFTGVAAPWLAYITAATQCREDGITQAVAVQTATDEIWVGCVSAPASDVKDIQDSSL
ncbi:hypothetical protein M2403_003181 [Rahnella sp. BIGb0603]|jgi:hypothetical protein|uniref:hypothetical protein n=1 Tax=Rahnella sp. BIGb0603 TaxID=2940612 RepID=UPI002168D16B|nr:hypothetical protein [Rahnella sp. BIGb0603]MCS3424558.1 hypothetical protein [Rahnella sp. BIGb0603]